MSHGAIAHFLTEDWDVEDPMITTAWYNCMMRYSRVLERCSLSTGEHREFAFTTSSTAEDAHVKETAESRKKRGKEPESDPHVLDQLEKVQEEAKNQNECA